MSKEKWVVYTERPRGPFGSTGWKYHNAFDSKEEAEDCENHIYHSSDGMTGVMIKKENVADD